METNRSWFQRNKGLAIFLSFLIIIIIGLFAWGQIERNSFNKRMERQKKEIINSSRNLIDEKRKNLLADLVKSLSWVVRSEALRNNFDQINLYLNEFVKGRDFALALFVNAEGIITVSSDKKMEQTHIREHFDVDYSTVGEINIQTLPDNKWVAIAPVMGLNTRAGTLVLIYDPGVISDNDFVGAQ